MSRYRAAATGGSSISSVSSRQGRSVRREGSTFRPATLLVEAKLHPPARRTGIVRRPRLLELLANPATPPIVSVLAPPGYGKSVLLADWAASDRRPAAWLSLDDNDNDPAVFLAYLAAAFDRIEPVEDGMRAAIAAPRGRILATAVPRLASELHRWGRPGLIILDDVHRLVDRVALDALTALLDHLPPGARVAIAARTQPDLPFGRLRVRPGLLEIGREALAFTDDEACELVTAAGRSASRAEIQRLTERTEGWPAGIYLATLAPSEARSVGARLGAVTGQDRYISEYLRVELQASLDEDDVGFLLRTSILELVEPAVADAVVGQPGAADRLRRLARTYLLVEPVASGGAYRYHNLLRDYLADELERREAGAAAGLHRAAAAWYEAAGRHTEAVRHAIASGDVDAAARLVTGVALRTFYGGQRSTLEGWLRRFDDTAFERHPPLAVIAGSIHLLNGRAAEADRMADIADRATFDEPPGDGSASFESSRAMLRAIMARHGPDAALANAEYAAAQEEPNSPWRTNALWLLGATRLLVGDVGGADGAFAGAVAVGALAGATSMDALAYRAAIAMSRGDWTTGERLARDSLQMLEAAHFNEIVAALMPYAVGARAAVHRGDRPAARQLLVRAQLVRPLATHAEPWFAVGSLLHVARAYLAMADTAGARSAILGAREILRARPNLGTLVPEFEELRQRVDEADSALTGPSTLTPAELQVLGILPTYLSFQEIADRLTVSRNTVKTQALSVYGKLGASSRSEAVQRAVELGLLEPFPGLAVTRMPSRP